MKYLTNREIQLAELDILKKTIKFFEQNNLTYWLYGGTALGAVRHGGFIPWDDDIDIIMPRDNYERLVRIMKKNNNINGLIVELPENQKEPRLLIGKVYDPSIKVEADNGHDSGYLWIDIMQLDGLPNNYKPYLRKLMLLRKIYLSKMRQKYNVYDKKKSKTVNIINRIKRLPLLVIRYDKLIKYILNYCKMYSMEDAEYVCNNCWYNTPSKIFEKRWFDGSKKVKFEDIEADICIGYDQFLSKRYGKDYMSIPPKEEQVTHSIKAWRVG